MSDPTLFNISSLVDATGTTTEPARAGRRYRLDAAGHGLPAGYVVEAVGAHVAANGAELVTVRIDGSVVQEIPIADFRAHFTLLPGGGGYCPHLGDAKRSGFGGDTTKRATAPAPAPDAAAAALDALRTLLTGGARAPEVDADEVREIATDAAREVAEESARTVRELFQPFAVMVADIVKSPAMMTRARIAVAAATSANPILTKLLPFYVAGTESPANVVITAPPAIGKTFAVRELGKLYDVYIEHGCTDDIDEVATLLGNPTPDGHGGFITVDGVLTQAVRAAAAGQTVLLMLDEVFRLGERPQEFLLSFLTGRETPHGKVYELRTRRVDPATGALEVIECPATNLHIVAAANLGARPIVEAFWSRWHVLRVPFDAVTVEAIALSVTAAHGINGAAALAKQFTGALTVSRAKVAEGALRFPLDVRALVRACKIAPKAEAVSVAHTLGQWVADSCAHWGVDSGETDPMSVDGVNAVRAALGVS